MPNRDHEPVIFDQFLGLYSRGEGDALPPGYLNFCDEFRFRTNWSIRGAGGGKITTRNPTSSVLSWPGGIPVNRFFFYPKSTGGRFIYLDSGGNFRDSVAGPGNIILTIVGATDFSAITINDRFYFFPHDRDIGMVSQFLYVYDPALAATARKAAGRAPILADGAFTIAAGAAGNTEPGFHILGVSYETNTGFITEPALYQTITAAAARTSISLTSIPIGPAGTVARHIVMSKVVKNYDGNPEGYALFFAIKINDNVTTVLANAVNLYDTQLISSADYLKDNMPEIPAGLQLCTFDGRLVMCGENADSTLVRVSKQGEPEVFNAIEGFIKCYKGMSIGPVRSVKATHGVLYMFKRYGTYSTRDIGKAPSSWPVDQIDAGLGAEVFSVSEVWESVDSAYRGGFFVSNFNGFYYLNGGVYSDNLARNIDADWSSEVTSARLNNLATVFDSFNQCAYINVVGFVYLCDLELGIGQPRYSRWRIGKGADIKCIHLIIGGSDGKPQLLYHPSLSGNLMKVDLSTNAFNNLESDANAKLEFVLADPEYRNIHLGVMKFMGDAAGVVTSMTQVAPAFGTAIAFTLNFGMGSSTGRVSRHEINAIGPMIRITFEFLIECRLRLEKVLFYLQAAEEEWPY